LVSYRRAHNKKGPANWACYSDWCGREDLNLHDLAATSS
jgi:hypothetical protein